MSNDHHCIYIVSNYKHDDCTSPVFSADSRNCNCMNTQLKIVHVNYMLNVPLRASGMWLNTSDSRYTPAS